MDLKFERPSTLLLQHIRRLDLMCYDKFDTPLSWYKYRYKDLEEILIARLDNRIIGYCCITGLDRRVLDLIKEGMFSGDYSISHRAYKSLYEVDTFYLSSIVIHPEERNKNIADTLITEAISNLQNYTKEYEIVALAVSDGGLRVTEKAGFKRLCSVEDVSIMYLSSKINTILKKRGSYNGNV